MKTSFTSTDPGKLFVRFGPTVVNATTIDSVMAGTHRAADPTTFLVSYVGSNDLHQIKGEDADVFAIDFHRLTGIDLYAVTEINKPAWVAQEMAPADTDLSRAASQFSLYSPDSPFEDEMAAACLRASLNLFHPSPVVA